MSFVGESDQDYLDRVVEPLLVQLRKAVLRDRPEDPVPVMVDLLNSRRSITNLVSTMRNSVVPISDDDDDDDPIASPVSAGVLSPSHSPSNVQRYFDRGARSSFSAVPTDDIMRLFVDEPANNTQSAEDFSRVRLLLEKSTLGRNRDSEELDLIARAMNQVVIETSGSEIDASVVILIEEGCLEKTCCSSSSSKVLTIGPGEVIGDSLFCTDTNILRSVGRVVFWRISQEYLDYITRRSAMERRERYFKFLSSVPIFSSMDEEELAKVCDALKPEKISAGTTFMKQGELGNKFCIVESGECVATRSYVTGQRIPTEIFRYRAGDYVGELSLLHNEPRQASVTAVTDVSVLCIDRKSFKRLLGPIQDILLRNTVRYQDRLLRKD